MDPAFPLRICECSSPASSPVRLTEIGPWPYALGSGAIRWSFEAEV